MELLTRLFGRPSQKPVLWYKGFTVSGGELEDGPTSGSEYNKRGTAEQWIKEGKHAVKMTRLSLPPVPAQRGPALAERDRLQFGNLWRRLALPQK